MQITRDNYASYAKLIQQMSGGKLNPADEYGTDYGNFSLRLTGSFACSMAKPCPRTGKQSMRTA